MVLSLVHDSDRHTIALEPATMQSKVIRMNKQPSAYCCTLLAAHNETVSISWSANALAKKTKYNSCRDAQSKRACTVVDNTTTSSTGSPTPTVANKLMGHSIHIYSKSHFTHYTRLIQHYGCNYFASVGRRKTSKDDKVWLNLPNTRNYHIHQNARFRTSR